MKLADLVDLDLTADDLDFTLKVSEEVSWAASISHAQLLHPAENCVLSHLRFMLNRSGYAPPRKEGSSAKTFSTGLHYPIQQYIPLFVSAELKLHNRCN